MDHNKARAPRRDLRDLQDFRISEVIFVIFDEAHVPGSEVYGTCCGPLVRISRGVFYRKMYLKLIVLCAIVVD